MKTEPVDRARYLMSPYNLREAKRAREIRHTMIGIGLTIVVALVIGGYFAWLQR